jgi:S1-C subfamily serine protease
VTPAVLPSQPLSKAEEAVIRIFESSTRSVVNIFDLSLQGRAPQTQAADAPEGNGSGIVWDAEGHIVTNYHVLANILKSLGPSALQKKDVKVRTHRCAKHVEREAALGSRVRTRR